MHTLCWEVNHFARARVLYGYNYIYLFERGEERSHQVAIVYFSIKHRKQLYTLLTKLVSWKQMRGKTLYTNALVLRDIQQIFNLFLP